MKKWIALALSLTLLLCLAACGQPVGGVPGGSEPPATEPDTRPLTEIMELVLADVPDLPMSFETEITAENFSYYFFIDPIEGAEALSSDAAIGTIAHSVCLLRLPEGVDPAPIVTEISESADPRKWICVEAESVTVLSKNNLILFVMSSNDWADKISSNFNETV